MLASNLRMHAARASLALGLVLLAAGTWLSLPRAGGYVPGRPLSIVLVDVSKSAIAPGPIARWRAWARARIEAELGRMRAEGGDIALVAYGQDVRRVRGPEPAASFDASIGPDDLVPAETPAGASASRLAAALELCARLVRDRSSGRIVLLSDGTFTGRDPRPVAAALARDGFRFELARVAPAESPHLGVSALRVPRAIEVGAPLVVTFEAWWTPGGEVRGPKLDCEVRRSDAAGTEARAVALEPPPGLVAEATGTLRWPVHVELGAARAGAIAIEVRARIHARDGTVQADPIPEDDASSALVRCAGSIVCGVAGSPGEREAFTRAFEASPGIQLLPLAPGEVAGALESLDVLVMLDTVLAPDAQALVAAFVRAGGAWLECAGRNWVVERAGPGAPGPLAAVAALEPRGDELPPRDVIALVDASGSMNGPPFESVRAALVRIADLVPARDDLEARFFAGALAPPIQLGNAAERADPARRGALLERLRAAPGPAGPTRLWLALEALARERTSAARDALVLLLTDGRDPDRADLVARGARVRRSLAAARVKLAIVATAHEPDLELLQSLLLEGESLRHVPDLARPDAADRLTEVFQREATADAIATGRTRVVPARAAEGSLAAELARAAGALPDIAMRVRARTAPSAELAWTTGEGEPICALQRVGRGLAAGLAFVPDEEWAPEWSARRALLAPLVRALGRAHADAQRDELRLIEDAGELVLCNVPRGFRARIAARAIGPEGREVALSFEAGRSGRDPLRERCAAASALLDAFPLPTVLRVKLDLPGADGLEFALPIPRPPEFARPPSAFVLPEEPNAAAPEPSRRTSHPLAAAALLAAVFLLASAAFLGVFSRGPA